MVFLSTAERSQERPEHPWELPPIKSPTALADMVVWLNICPLSLGQFVSAARLGRAGLFFPTGRRAVRGVPTMIGAPVGWANLGPRPPQPSSGASCQGQGRWPSPMGETSRLEQIHSSSSEINFTPQLSPRNVDLTENMQLDICVIKSRKKIPLMEM